jgi:hypothetical protein
MMRRPHAVLLLLLVVILLGLAVAAPALQPAPPPFATATAAAPPIQTEVAGGPAPTALPGREGPNYALTISTPDFGKVLHGAAPYTLDITGGAFSAPGCRAVHWEWGDGAEDAVPCASDADTPGVQSYSGRHTYTRPGIYYLRLRLTAPQGDVRSESQTVLVGAPTPRDATADVVRWGLWALTLAGAVALLLWLRRRPRRSRRIGYALVALALISFVPPFSYLPNPVGALASYTGFSYDPRLPFANGFLLAGDPQETLRPTLDALIGQTGLDPLDARQPLAGYEFVGITSPPRYGQVTVTVRMRYADGSSRDYPIGAGWSFQDVFGFWRSDWRYDGLARVRAEHVAYPGIPLGAPDRGPRLETPQRLPLPAAAAGLTAILPEFDFGAHQALAWAPAGDAFLTTQVRDNRATLWLVPLDGAAPRALAEDVGEFAWAPDGRSIVYVQMAAPTGVWVVGADGQGRRALIPGSEPAPTLPGLTADGAWYAQGDRLLLVPFAGGPARQVGTLARVATAPAVAPTADGRRVAYFCGGRLCLQDTDGAAPATAGVGGQRLAWSPDGALLAVVEWDAWRPWDTVPALTVVRRDGSIAQARRVIAPNGPAGAPQWAGAGHVLVATFPNVGRRITLLDVASGALTDLTQPRWDPWFAVAPDGGSLLLTNGRGGFWRAALRLGG